MTKGEVKEVFRKREEQRAGWGPRKRFFRDVEQRRRMEWKNAEE